MTSSPNPILSSSPSPSLTQIFGEFRESLPNTQEGLTIVFYPTYVSLKQRWRNNGLSADFMADYFATFFPGADEATTETLPKEELKSAVSFIANELLENAMKFNDETSSYPITFRLQMHPDRLVFVSSNSIKPQAIENFQAFLKEITTSDPGELYICQLEKNAESENISDSGLGFLTMINDYQAQLGWKFEPTQKKPETIAVTIMVQLTLKATIPEV